MNLMPAALIRRSEMWAYHLGFDNTLPTDPLAMSCRLPLFDPILRVLTRTFVLVPENEEAISSGWMKSFSCGISHLKSAGVTEDDLTLPVYCSEGNSILLPDRR